MTILWVDNKYLLPNCSFLSLVRSHLSSCQKVSQSQKKEHFSVMLHLVVNPCLMWLPSLSKNILVVIDTVDQVSADQSVKQYLGAKSPELPFFTSP